MDQAMTAELHALYREVENGLGMKPLELEAQGYQRGIRAVFLPSNQLECGVTFLGAGDDSMISVHCANASIRSYLSQKKGTAPGAGNEVLEPGPLNSRCVADGVKDLSPWIAKADRVMRDGMPVRIEVIGERVEPRVFELLFPEDAKSPQGRLAMLLCDLSVAHCQSAQLRASLTALWKYA